MDDIDVQVRQLKDKFYQTQKEHKGSDSNLQRKLGVIAKELSLLTGNQYLYGPGDNCEYKYSIGCVIATKPFDLSDVEL